MTFSVRYHRIGRRIARMLAVARVEILHLIHDRTTISLILLVPAIQIVLFGYVVNLDKRQLEGAPAFDVGDEPAWGDRAYESKIHDYYGVGPYWAL